jgi:DNA-binding NarL/FixJ family response regulator
MVTLLIADDHPIFREGLVRIIEQDTTFSIVAHTGDGGEALRLIKELCPDIAILDISMPTLSGLDIARAAQREKLAVEFIILTMYKDERYFNAAMDLGVKGYLPKDSIVPELLACVRAVANGRYYISPSISELLLDRKTRFQSKSRAVPAIVELTPAERRLLKMVAENKTSKEIADELSISVRTVDNHRTNICNKLGIKGRNKLLQFAIENKSIL